MAKEYAADIWLYEDNDEEGKKVRSGKFRMSFEIANTIAKQAKELNVSKSALVRKVLESYIKFYQESKAIGGPKLYDVEKSIDDWVVERSELSRLLNEIKRQNAIMQKESQSPEVKMLSMQIETLAQMFNLIHKSV